MKNSSNKFRGKNNKEYKKNSDFGYYSKNTNRLDKNDKLIPNRVKEVDGVLINTNIINYLLLDFNEIF